MSDEEDKRWLKNGIELGMHCRNSPSYGAELFMHGMNLGQVAEITPELVDLSEERLNRICDNWKRTKGIGI